MDALQQLGRIERGCAEIISKEELKEKLALSIKNKTPLKIKAGFDPTAPDIHLGHTVLLRKLRQFQDFGHTVYFLIGDFTARIGDPSGQNKTRPAMSDEDIKRNASTYKAQVFKILDPQKTKIVFNNDWFSRMSIYDVLDLMKHATVSQILTRADFRNRLKEDMEIRAHEFLYPLLQAYDSVHIKADVEMGGTDQRFNLLLGRELQRDFGLTQQAIVMLPLLEGTDGVNKMSKSLGNYVGINDSPSEMFGKIMSISDALMYRYYELLTDEDLPRIKNMHPMEAKEKLANDLVGQYHGQAKAEEAKSGFEKIFKDKGAPADASEYKIARPTKILDILTESGLAKSRNEARRLIQQGGVIYADDKIKDENFLIAESGTLRAGTRRFLKVIINK